MNPAPEDGDGQSALLLFQVDAFADRLFAGNPAAVCPLERWLPDGVMQAIAEENRLPETAFCVREGEAWRLRWFTPVTEVDLCGHATLAAAKVLFDEIGTPGDVVCFETRSGRLTVRREAGRFVLDFPALAMTACETVPAALERALPGVEFEDVLRGDDWLVRVGDEASVRALRPDFAALRELPGRGVIVTAAGGEADFVSRFFAPKCGIDEDSVTGSAHCALAPYWAGILGKTQLEARQLSARGGCVACETEGDRVRLGGEAVVYLRGEIELPEPGRSI